MEKQTKKITRNAAFDTGDPKPSWMILAFLCLAGFMTFLDVSIVNVSLPTIEKSLHITESQLQYIVTAYGTVLGGCLLLSGRLADVFGRRRMLRVGLVVFSIASLTAGISQGALVLIVARAIQGLGAAFIAPAALSLLTTTFTQSKARAQALGVWGGMSGLASVVGVVLGGLLTEGPGWRWIFFINVPIGLAAALVAPRVAPESKNTEQGERFDLIGAITLTTGLLLCIYTLGQTTTWGWDSLKTIGGLAGAIGILFVFWLNERHTKSPLVPFSVFRHRTIQRANLAALCMLGTLVTLFFFASLYMQQVLGYSPARTGLAYVPIAVIISVGAGISQGLVRKAPVKPVLLTGLSLLIIGMVLLWHTPIHASYLKDILPAFLTAGLGIGLSFVPIQIMAFRHVDEPHSGIASGLINTSQEFGGVLGLAIAASIAFSRIPGLTKWAGGNPQRILAARASVFHEAFFLAACFAFIGFLIAFTIRDLRINADAAIPRNSPTPQYRRPE